MPGPTVTVNPTGCTTEPTGKVHAPKKSQNGFVNFNATAACTIQFQDSTVFNRSRAQLRQGNNQLDSETESGHTTVSIVGCLEKAKKSLGAGGDPTDITVPKLRRLYGTMALMH